MKRCELHDLEFGYTCPACDARWSYVSRINLIDFFDAGVRGSANLARTLEEKAAYEHGSKYREKKSA